MKFMKLGTRPDTFFTTEDVRSVCSEVATDIKIKVQNSVYLLHKFPILSKCSRLRTLCSESKDTSQQTILDISDIPGGSEAFETCIKFCYGIIITISALNFTKVRCASHYLQMNDDLEKGNLVTKLEVFFSSCILHRYKDVLVTLQSTIKCYHLCEELHITSRCIDSIASKIISYSSKDDWSRYNKGWWVDDISILSIDHFSRIMSSMKASNIVSGRLRGEALEIYASRWLPINNLNDTKHELTILETLARLLPEEENCLPCSFFLKLVKAANFLCASSSLKMELAKKASFQIEEANVSDLLIPSVLHGDKDMLYDVDIVMTMLEERILQVKCPHSSMLRVAKRIDCYLQEIAKDVNLPVEKVVALAEAVPDFARLNHDDLYRVIDVYLRAHPNLNKSERKKLCRILNCKKLSAEACRHAAQNNMLPLRVVVQVLFFEQSRAAMHGTHVSELSSNIKVLLDTTAGFDENKEALKHDDCWRVQSLKQPKSKLETLKMKLEEDDDDVEVDTLIHRNELLRSSSFRFQALCSIRNRPKRMLNKFWPGSRSVREI